MEPTLKFKKDKRITYFEQTAKKNKSPGAGTYKIEGAFAKLSVSPRMF
jgi:hypothetical protein